MIGTPEVSFDPLPCCFDCQIQMCIASCALRLLGTLTSQRLSEDPSSCVALDSAESLAQLHSQLLELHFLRETLGLPWSLQQSLGTGAVAVVSALLDRIAVAELVGDVVEKQVCLMHSWC
jgi:hypothetical protein